MWSVCGGIEESEVRIGVPVSSSGVVESGPDKVFGGVIKGMEIGVRVDSTEGLMTV